MKIRPIIFSAPMVRALLDGRKTQTRRLATSPLAKCEPGDLLYVRESFSPSRYRYEPVTKNAPPQYVVFADGGQMHTSGSYTPALDKYASGAFDGIKWRPSIHMPRWASRLTLEVTDVRTHRLQMIRNSEIAAEGFKSCVEMAWLWDELHGEGAWRSDPEVVALTFKVHKVNVDEFTKVRAA